jgi:hypothetical protein
MHRDTPSQSALKTADIGSQCLPGFRLTHTIHLVSDVNLDVVARTAAHLKSESAPVSHWAVAQRGDILEQKIVLNDISERQARMLREQLLNLEDVLRARLEHRFVRVGSDSEPTSCIC